MCRHKVVRGRPARPPRDEPARGGHKLWSGMLAVCGLRACEPAPQCKVNQPCLLVHSAIVALAYIE